MPDLAAAYEQTRATMTELVSGIDPARLGTTVPACPDWTVQDLIAHVTAIAADISSGDFPADLNPSAFWDAEMAKRREAFVDESLAVRREMPLGAILDEWENATPALTAMMRGERPWPSASIPLPEWIVLTDLAVHHHDLRGALGMPGDRDSLATGLSLRSYVEGMRFRAIAENLPPFEIVADSRRWVVGSGDPGATVTADPFELARAASGRRSPDQIRGYDWQGDPEPHLAYFYPYGLRIDPLVE